MQILVVWKTRATRRNNPEDTILQRDIIMKTKAVFGMPYVEYGKRFWIFKEYIYQLLGR
jgi:hypothetical protein